MSLCSPLSPGAGTLVNPLCRSSRGVFRWAAYGGTCIPAQCSCSGQRSSEEKASIKAVGRRDALAMVALLSAPSFLVKEDAAAALPEQVYRKLCDTDCELELENIPTTTTSSGLEYKDIKVGTGPSPPVGFQVAANYVAMVPPGKVFDSSLDKGTPYIFRVGAGQVIKGLDEGLLSMKVGGIRRLYIPGELAFPKGLGAAAGRPRVPPSSPVIFDVNLLYIPGLEDSEEE